MIVLGGEPQKAYALYRLLEDIYGEVARLDLANVSDAQLKILAEDARDEIPRSLFPREREKAMIQHVAIQCMQIVRLKLNSGGGACGG